MTTDATDGVPLLKVLVSELDAAQRDLERTQQAADTAWQVWELAQDDHIRAEIRHAQAVFRYEAHRRQAVT